MSKTSLEGFFKGEKRPNDKTAQDSFKITNKKKVACKRKYQQFYLNYKFPLLKLRTIGEELILSAAKGICCELLGEAAVQKVTHFSFS